MVKRNSHNRVDDPSRIDCPKPAVAIIDEVDGAVRSNRDPRFGEVPEIKLGVYGETTISRESLSPDACENRECSFGRELENLVTGTVENENVAVMLGSKSRRLDEVR
jgi:hypothetical protein